MSKISIRSRREIPPVLWWAFWNYKASCRSKLSLLLLTRMIRNGTNTIIIGVVKRALNLSLFTLVNLATLE
jgi:hypothetical protein